MPVALLATLLPGLFPPIMDGMKAIINKFTGASGYDPKSIDDAVKLMEAQAKFASAMAVLDKPEGNISSWVSNLRASFRYLAAAVIILGTLIMIIIDGLTDGKAVDPQYMNAMLQMTASTFSFIFGDRLYLHLRGGNDK